MLFSSCKNFMSVGKGTPSEKKLKVNYFKSFLGYSFQNTFINTMQVVKKVAKELEVCFND